MLVPGATGGAAAVTGGVGVFTAVGPLELLEAVELDLDILVGVAFSSSFLAGSFVDETRARPMVIGITDAVDAFLLFCPLLLLPFELVDIVSSDFLLFVIAACVT